MSMQKIDMKEERAEWFISFPFFLKYLHLERNLSGGFSELDIIQQTRLFQWMGSALLESLIYWASLWFQPKEDASYEGLILLK